MSPASSPNTLSETVLTVVRRALRDEPTALERFRERISPQTVAELLAREGITASRRGPAGEGAGPLDDPDGEARLATGLEAVIVAVLERAALDEPVWPPARRAPRRASPRVPRQPGCAGEAPRAR
jgi:hypothetical protein